MCKWFFFLCLVVAGFSEEKAPDVAKISEAMGHLIGKNLQSLGLQVNLDAVVKGIQDSSKGKLSPMSEDECVEALATMQEESLVRVSEINLDEADSFLEKNKKEAGIVSLEEGKVQYRITQKGEEASAVVEPYNSPIVKYTASYLDGTVFGSSNGNEILLLEEAIPGFSKGIIGMHEGETRTLYIHPDVGYGDKSQLNPNSLLVFEVTLIKADAAAEVASSDQEIPKNLIAEETR